ncbi:MULTISPECIES: hypothetical protein [Chryseobacterium]|uniref:O-antigen ligase domain-containing protein n=1 Tax=Chryseobacterium rhizosphaerae TaxID=395937 RepID=A0AAE3YBL8_9FLAO|nr:MULTISPECIES: hypothetical protein [Chryseobacterium]MBL3546567.1 hypothetical protein [Chryseobacterium sp. KMC2]MDC8099705.1 hypothetical protein [Chryseobacterium rhizosphaerae]MDR6528609.1 hypothetical protein [Chryseobacterium rhizosphaerae]
MQIYKKQIHFNALSVLMVVTAFLLFVFPNSFRPVKLVLLLLIFLVGLTKVQTIERAVIFSVVLSIIVTIIYLIVGIHQSLNPSEALSQVLIVYIFTPILWVVILNYCFEKFKVETIVKYLNIYMVLGAVSVFLAIWLFMNGKRKILELIIEDPNMTFTKKGIVEMKLFVYGSLIFFIPAFLQLEKVFKKKSIYFVIILTVVIAAIVSGRSALLLSVFVGLFFYVITNSSVKLVKYFIIGLLLTVVLIFILNNYGVNVFNVLEGFYVKIFEGGDKARSEQTIALIKGVNNNIFGAGHGVGVDYIRSKKFPWRYENVPVAIIYRVSIFGFLIYSIPFLYSVYKYVSIKIRNPYDHYMLAGIVSMLIATFTNPYLESFEFNIFYVLPFIYFVKRDKDFQ